MNVSPWRHKPRLRAERYEIAHPAIRPWNAPEYDDPSRSRHLSTNSRQIFDYDVSRQYIQLDDPQVVLKAIRDVLDTMRKHVE